jgi:hypothetical protein
MFDPEKIDDPSSATIRVKREMVLGGIPLQIGTPLAEVQLPDAITVRNLADAIAAGDVEIV